MSRLTCQLFLSHSVNCSDRVSVKIDHGSVNLPPIVLILFLLVADVSTTTYLDTTGYDPSVTTAGGTTTLVDTTTGQPFYTSVMSPTVTPYATTTHPGGQTSNILNLPPDAIVTSQQSGGLLTPALPQTPVTTLSSSVDMHHHQMAPQFILHEEHVPQQSDNRIDLGQIVRQTIETNHLQQFDLQVS